MELSMWLSILYSSRRLSWTFLQTLVVPPAPSDIPFHVWVVVKMCWHICENVLAYFNNLSVWGGSCAYVMWLCFSIPLFKCFNEKPYYCMVLFACECADDFHCFVGHIWSRADNFSVWIHLINRWFRVFCFGSWIYSIQ